MSNPLFIQAHEMKSKGEFLSKSFAQLYRKILLMQKIGNRYS